MAEPILNENMEKSQSESNLSITSNDIKIDLSKEFLVELRKNMYHGTHYKDVVDHIAYALKMVDLIYVPGVDSHQLQMKVFPLSLTDDAKEWWISYGDEKIPLRRNLLRNSSVDSISNHTMEKMKCWTKERTGGLVSNINTSFKYQKKVDGRTQKVIFHAWMNGNWNKRYVDNCISSSNELKESKYENPSNIATDSFFKAYRLPNKRRCKAEKFEDIQYSLGPNEEYIAIRSYEYDIWERNKDNMSKIYQDIFQKRDEGWKGLVKEISTNIGGEFKYLEILKCWSLETSRQLFNIILLINATWRIYRAIIRRVSHSNSF
ncbi:hypothetical protein Tco_1000210 [Tanacetum coccineum]